MSPLLMMPMTDLPRVSQGCTAVSRDHLIPVVTGERPTPTDYRTCFSLEPKWGK